MKKIIIAFLILVTGVLGVLPAQAQVPTEAKKSVNVYFFWGEGCPHCAKEKPFLEQMKEKYPELEVHDYEVWGNGANRDLMVEFGKKLNATVNGVPFTVVGEQYVVGWMDEKNTGAQIEEAINCAINKFCRDVGQEIKGNNITAQKKESKNSKIPETLTLPLIGEIQTKNISLPVLTIIIGALDGFNPCSMWTLMFLIGLLLGMQNRRRMWILGSAFIIASATVYFLFLSAWLNLLLFIGFIFWVRVIIALVALVGGGYYLKEYFLNPHAGCVSTKTEDRKKVFEKLKILTHEKHFLIALIGIILLAIAVNLVELICSAGLPAVYTQILTLSELPTWQYYGYLLLYIFVFMLDDLIVFFVAMITLKMTGISDKYSRISHLIGGIAMAIIGILLLFKPEWLMFG
jgi:thiol-disulfide isomerase/thioredoxin